MKIESHILDNNGLCDRCGMDLKPAMSLSGINHSKVKLGGRVGILTSGIRSIPRSAYRIKREEFDSNPFCAPLPDSIP